MRQIKGGFTFAILTKDALYGAVDPNAIRPLVVGKMQDDTYILASETCAIDVLGAEYVQDIHAGEYVVINNEGIEVKSYTSHTNTAISAMEYIYFARPDSTIAGKMFMLFVKHLEKISTKKALQMQIWLLVYPTHHYQLQVGMLKKVTYLMKWGW